MTSQGSSAYKKNDVGQCTVYRWKEVFPRAFRITREKGFDVGSSENHQRKWVTAISFFFLLLPFFCRLSLRLLLAPASFFFLWRKNGGGRRIFRDVWVTEPSGLHFAESSRDGVRKERYRFLCNRIRSRAVQPISKIVRRMPRLTRRPSKQQFQGLQRVQRSCHVSMQNVEIVTMLRLWPKST